MALLGQSACGTTDSIIGSHYLGDARSDSADERAARDASSTLDSMFDQRDDIAKGAAEADASMERPGQSDSPDIPDASEDVDPQDAPKVLDASPDIDADVRGPPEVGPSLGPTHTIALGGGHTCALRPNGTVACWGLNEWGELGDGTERCHWLPRSVEGLADVVEVAAGYAHSCARLADETVRCWGNNERGQLGDGTEGGFHSLPVTVRDLSGVRSLALSMYHSCARLSDGTVKC
jgi:hypothetical protein